jgi:hypothetical protein
MNVSANKNPELKPKDFSNEPDIRIRACILGCGLVWYVCITRVNGTLVHSHQSGVEVIIGKELKVASLGLRDGVPGMMSGLTSGWIGDP